MVGRHDSFPSIGRDCRAPLMSAMGGMRKFAFPTHLHIPDRAELRQRELEASSLVPFKQREASVGARGNELADVR
jgi:hypothetical protein